MEIDLFAGIAVSDLEPRTQETYDNGVRKALFSDPDGNELGIGGAPTALRVWHDQFRDE